MIHAMRTDLAAELPKITADRVQPNTFYLYYPGNGVYKTTNGGAAWTQAYNAAANGDLTAWDFYNFELQSVPGEAGQLFFTGGAQGNGGPPAPSWAAVLPASGARR